MPASNDCGNSGNDIGRQADLILQIIDQSVAGVAIVPTTMPTTPVHQIRQLQKNRIPVVFCHRTVEGISAPSVVFSGKEIGNKAAELFLTNGHRKIAMLYSHSYAMFNDRLLGMQASFRQVWLRRALGHRGRIRSTELCT